MKETNKVDDGDQEDEQLETTDAITGISLGKTRNLRFEDSTDGKTIRTRIDQPHFAKNKFFKFEKNFLISLFV